MTVAAVSSSRPAARSLADRLAAAYPLAVAYALLVLLYGWQSTRHPTPWLFVDELKWAELSRSIAHTGHPLLRSRPAGYDSLYAYFLAPAWWLGATGRAYAAAKYMNVVVMTASLFPAYLFARLLLPRWPAVAVGVLTAAAPALSYSLMLIPEPLAYFWSAVVLWLVARALLRPTRATVVAAVASLVLAPYVRSQLAMLIPVALLALAVYALSSDRSKAFLRTWTWRERIGAAVLVVGAVVVLGALGNHHVWQWNVAWSYGVRGRMFTFGMWAAGAFTIGLGVLPVIGALAWLLGTRLATPRERALFAVLTSLVVVVGMYTALKAAYLSTIFADRVEERNLIYLAPAVFAAAAAWLLSHRLRLVPLALAGAAVGYLIQTTPLHMYEHFYSDAPGYSVLQWLNQKWYFTETDGIRLLWGILAGTFAIALLLAAGRRRGLGLRVGVPAGLVLASLALAWNLTGEIAAANSSNVAAGTALATLPSPPDWIDRDTGRSPAMFIGQSLGDTNANALWLTEFWNQSIQTVWSTDASAPPPGPSFTPNFFPSPAGKVAPQLPVDWAVVGTGVEMLGKEVDHGGALALVRLTKPIRMAQSTGGITPDGWLAGTPATAFFNLFATKGDRAGTVEVDLTRQGVACGSTIPTAVVHVLVSPIRIDPNGQPAHGRGSRSTTVVLPQCENRVVRWHVTPPVRVEVSAAKGSFQPNAFDQRHLVAQLGFSFTPARR